MELQIFILAVLASRVVNAIKSFNTEERSSGVRHTPNKKVKALGTISSPVTFSDVGKVSDLMSSWRGSSKTRVSNVLWPVCTGHTEGILYQIFVQA